MFLWTQWYSAISLMRPAFSHYATFVWFIVCVAGLSVRSDNLGVSSIVRGLSLDGDRDYFGLLRNVHNDAIDLMLLRTTWTRVVLKIFGDRIERVNGRLVVIADGLKIAKSGKKMPGVKSLFQEFRSALRIDTLITCLRDTLSRCDRPLRNELPEFLLVGAENNPIAKFIVEQQAPDCGYYQDKAAQEM